MNRSERKKITEKENNPIQQSKNTKSNQNSTLIYQHKNQFLQMNDSNSQQETPLNHKYIIQNKYNQPIVITPDGGQNGIIMNQDSPKSKKVFKSIYPKYVVCPYCKQKVLTRVEENFNTFTCILHIFFIIALPLFIFSMCNGNCSCSSCNDCKCDCCDCSFCCGKNCDCKCCYDGTHYCAKCGNELGKHYSNRCKI